MTESIFFTKKICGGHKHTQRDKRHENSVCYRYMFTVQGEHRRKAPDSAGDGKGVRWKELAHQTCGKERETDARQRS